MSYPRLFIFSACLCASSMLALAQGTTCTADGDSAGQGSPVACVTGAGVQVRPVGEAAPVEGAPPLTPEQKPATPPTVTYENGKLMIIAKNAVLGDILNAVAEKTGATIDVPEAATERVVSQLGPGPARDVIAALLNGSHFNYVMVGSEESPNSVARVVLTAKSDTKTDAPKGSATPSPVLASNTPRPNFQPRTARGQSIMQPYKEMLEQQQAQEAVTPDSQPQPGTPTATTEPVAAAVTPDGTSSANASTAGAATNPAPTGTETAVAAGTATNPAAAGTETSAAAGIATNLGPTGTETAAVSDPAAAGEAAKNPGERTPTQVLQDLYEARRQMMQAQRQPPPTTSPSQ
jgi:hypothetical protein